MNIKLSATSLRKLKGAPLSVLMALIMAHQPVNQKWIETVTGYSDKPVSMALDFLRESGYIQKLSGQKFVIASAVQLPFFQSGNELSTDYPQNEEENLKSRNYSDFPTTTTTTTIEGTADDRGGVAVDSVKSRNYSDFLENRRKLLELGIGEPKRSFLADLEWVNINYINYMWDHSDNQVGLFIYKVEHHDPLPESHNYYQKFLNRGNKQ